MDGKTNWNKVRAGGHLPRSENPRENLRPRRVLDIKQATFELLSDLWPPRYSPHFSRCRLIASAIFSRNPGINVNKRYVKNRRRSVREIKVRAEAKRPPLIPTMKNNVIYVYKLLFIAYYTCVRRSEEIEIETPMWPKREVFRWNMWFSIFRTIEEVNVINNIVSSVRSEFSLMWIAQIYMYSKM